MGTNGRRIESNLVQYKRGITAYSIKHYGEQHGNSGLNEVRGIVLHYTVTNDFPWNLVDSTSEAGEEPGVACHFVVDGTKVYQLLPLDTKGRCTFGANHNTISIEIVAMDAADLAKRTASMDTAAVLAAELLELYGLNMQALYSHAYIDSNINCNIPWISDLTLKERCPAPEKIDPGESNMAIMRYRADLHRQAIAARNQSLRQNVTPRTRPRG